MTAQDEEILRSAECRTAKKELHHVIKRPKAHYWRELANDFNRYPWELEYKAKDHPKALSSPNTHENSQARENRAGIFAFPPQKVLGLTFSHKLDLPLNVCDECFPFSLEGRDADK